MGSVFKVKFSCVAVVFLVAVSTIVIWLQYGHYKHDPVPDQRSIMQHLKEKNKQNEYTIKMLNNELEKHKSLLDAASKNKRSSAEEALAEEARKKTTTANNENKELVHRSPFVGSKLIHLDLKGAAPKMSYLLKLIPIVKHWGATGFLIEYEDMFPYDGDLSVLKSPYAYTTSEITSFLKESQKNDFLLIPLVQTFGHIEFVLKHKKFAHLRHVMNMTNVLNPAHRGSLALVKTMIKQLVDFHKPYIKYLHIGGDEVWTLKKEADPISVYVNHMNPIIDYVVSTSNTPIVWDDMMRSWNVEQLRKMSSKRVQPMVWAYPADLSDHFPEGMWQRYSKAFDKIWIASAFKGAEKPWTDYVTIGDRLKNHAQWLELKNEIDQYEIKILGIALTGWSRFDHDSVLCELLPASLPSLALCLALLNEGDLSKEKMLSVSKELGFKSHILTNPGSIPRNITDIDEGTFPGHAVFRVVTYLRQIDDKLNSVELRVAGWFNRRQTATRPLNVYHLSSCFERLESVLYRLANLKKTVKPIFSPFVSDNTIDEWIWDKITTKQQKCVSTKQHLTALVKRRKINPVSKTQLV